MDPVEPWIDADAVRRMAAQLLTRAEPSSFGEPADAGFGPGFEGFVADPGALPEVEVAPRPVARETGDRPGSAVEEAPPVAPFRDEPRPAEDPGGVREASAEAAAPPPLPDAADAADGGRSVEPEPFPERPAPGPPEPAPRSGTFLPPPRIPTEPESLWESLAEDEPEEPPAGELCAGTSPAETASEPAASPSTGPAPADEHPNPFREGADGDLPAAPSGSRAVDDGVVAPEESPFRRVEQPPAPAPAGEDPSRGQLLARLGFFRDSLCRHADAKGVFILDHEGDVILDDPSFGKLHFLARSLAQAYRPGSGQAGNVHVKVGAEAFLVVVPVDTRRGCMVLGTVLRQPLDAAAVEVVSKALAKAVDG